MVGQWSFAGLGATFVCGRWRTKRAPGREMQTDARKATNSTDPSQNRLLAGLPSKDRALIAPLLEYAELSTREVLVDVGTVMPWVYFPIDFVGSVLALDDDGNGVEVATIGREGFVGVASFLGADQTNMQIFAQVPGRGLRMKSRELPGLLGTSPALKDRMALYTQALFMQVAQASACNRLHSVLERAARWLLLTHDRTVRDEFPLSHDFLAQMMGVRRASVTLVLGQLKRQKAVSYRRGIVTVTDRPALEEVSCHCYRLIKDELDRLLGNKRQSVTITGVSKAGYSTLGAPRPRISPRRRGR